MGRFIFFILSVFLLLMYERDTSIPYGPNGSSWSPSALWEKDVTKLGTCLISSGILLHTQAFKLVQVESEEAVKSAGLWCYFLPRHQRIQGLFEGL